MSNSQDFPLNISKLLPAIQINDSSYGTDESDVVWGSTANRSFIFCLYGVFSIVGIVGNLIVTVVLLRVPTLRSNTSDFLVHLSLVDLLVCILVIPFKIIPTTGTSAPNPGFLGELRCRVYVSQFIFWVSTLTSVLCLVTVNVERFVAIVYPLKYKMVFTRQKKYLMIASCWILGGISKSFQVLLYSEDDVVGCHFLGWPSRGVQAFVGLYTFTIQLLAPFVLMITAQWKVILALRRQVEKLTERSASSALNPLDQRKMWQLRASQTLIKTLLTFVITFAVCWAPNQVVFLGYSLGLDVDFASPVYHVGNILAVCNSCVNPIIYTLMNQPFRKGIREAFCRKSRRWVTPSV
ncbi:somatostatin receptor type 4-like [Asterias amurensis]|uniref:somatostatin receptor type 4-like n=1 Tax=Asterias amurensis TaxID=7602 RepID=UPI003AB2DDE4